jgi:hypothetical protein
VPPCHHGRWRGSGLNRGPECPVRQHRRRAPPQLAAGESLDSSRPQLLRPQKAGLAGRLDLGLVAITAQQIQRTHDKRASRASITRSQDGGRKGAKSAKAAVNNKTSVWSAENKSNMVARPLRQCCLLLVPRPLGRVEEMEIVRCAGVAGQSARCLARRRVATLSAQWAVEPPAMGQPGLRSPLSASNPLPTTRQSKRWTVSNDQPARCVAACTLLARGFQVPLSSPSLHSYAVCIGISHN